MESGLQTITRRHENVVESFILLLRRQSARLKLIGCKGGKGGGQEKTLVFGVWCLFTRMQDGFLQPHERSRKRCKGGVDQATIVFFCLFLQAERPSLRFNDRAGVWRLIISGSGQLVVFFFCSVLFLSSLYPASLHLPPEKKQTCMI